MISKSVFDTLGVVPDFISSYDARKYSFPELMSVRKFKKDGTALTDKQISKMYQYYLVIIHLMLIKIYPLGKSFRIRTTNYMVLIKKIN
jgi:hypothetical protein